MNHVVSASGRRKARHIEIDGKVLCGRAGTVIPAPDDSLPVCALCQSRHALRERCNPILFSEAMVKAILAGTKTQTRRIIKPAPENRVVLAEHGVTIGADPSRDGSEWLDVDGINPGKPISCPYGVPGDTLWVRETWAINKDFDDVSPRCAWDSPKELRPEKVWFEASPEEKGDRGKWRPSIHMPREASRIKLMITDIRAERVQEISPEDAIAEGIERLPNFNWKDYIDGPRQEFGFVSPGRSFQSLWDSINKARGYGWEKNPWVWVVEFEVA